MRTQARSAVVLSLILAPLAAGAQMGGLQAAPDALGGPVWQARFERDAQPLGWRSASWLLPDRPATRVRLLGDYQFDTLRLGDTGGLRLTGGLLLSLQAQADGSVSGAGLSARPYAGIGYASGSLDGRWGFSADLGLTGAAGASLRWGRPAADAELQPRLQPTVRLGMSLAF